MQTIHIRRNWLAAVILLLLAACKKDKDSNSDTAILQPVVEKLSRTSVQAGETLTVYGKNLSQPAFLTDVAIHDIPAEILIKSGDSLVILVPPKTSTGILSITISKDQQFKAGYGPSVNIKPTPLIKSFWPLYAYGGDNLTLVVENFSANNTDNRILLNGEPVQITGGNGRDTMLVKLPASARTGKFNWNTFNGPVQQMDSIFRVRQTNYAVTTASGWLHADPAFSFMDSLFRGYPVLGGINYEIYAPMYKEALSYLGDPTRTYTIFLPADESYTSKNIRLNDYLNLVKDKPYAYNGPMVSAIVPGIQLSINDLHDGDQYNTRYTQELVFGGDPEMVIKMAVSEENGYKYVNLLGIYGETNPRVRILREHKIGNATIIETDGETGVIYF